MSNVSLSSGIRTNLLALQQNTALFDLVNSRLATGRRVNTAVDNPTNYFADINLKDRGAGLRARLDAMGQSIQRIQAADSGITRMRSLVGQMKGIVNSALSEVNETVRGELGKQFNSLIVQMSELVRDSSYAGVNLVSGLDRDAVQFNESFDDSKLEVLGFNVQRSGRSDDPALFRLDGAGMLRSASAEQAAVADASSSTRVDLLAATEYAIFLTTPYSGSANVAIGIKSFGFTSADGKATDYGATGDATGAHNVDWTAADYKTSLTGIVSDIEQFDVLLKAQASAMANNLAVITNREEFTEGLINVLQTGGDRLVLADLNEEAANLLALQTGNQLGTQALALANQQTQSVLQLLG